MKHDLVNTGFYVESFVLDVVGPRRSPKWRGVAKKHLLEYPRCFLCGAITWLNVHHVIPYHVNPELELVTTNLVTLCETPGLNCHFGCGHLGDWHNWWPAVKRARKPFLRLRNAMRLHLEEAQAESGLAVADRGLEFTIATIPTWREVVHLPRNAWGLI